MAHENPVDVQIAQVELLTMIIFALQSLQCCHGTHEFIYACVWPKAIHSISGEVFDLFGRRHTNVIRNAYFQMAVGLRPSEVGSVSAVGLLLFATNYLKCLPIHNARINYNWVTADTVCGSCVQCEMADNAETMDVFLFRRDLQYNAVASRVYAISWFVSYRRECVIDAVLLLLPSFVYYRDLR